jgi:hypothetical protein
MLMAGGSGVTIDMATSYQPMSLATLARHLVSAIDDKVRWKLIWEFLEEYRWEPVETQVCLVQAEPDSVGDERWDALHAALVEHLRAQHDLAPPEWTETRVLRQAWFPAELAIQRVDALAGRRPHSATTACTCQFMTWRRRDRHRRRADGPG